MNANGSDFLTVTGATAFETHEPGVFSWDAGREVLRITPADRPRLADVARPDALATWSAAGPVAVDRHGQYGLLNDDATELHYALSWPPTESSAVQANAETNSGIDTGATILDPVSAPADATFDDLHIGTGDRIALSFSAGADGHGVLLVDLDRRWQRTVALPVRARRVWVDHEQRVWAASDTHLMLCSGQPLPQPYLPVAGRFEPVNIEPDPPRLIAQRLLPAGASLLAMAADHDWLFLLTWRADGSPTGHRQTILRIPLTDDLSGTVTGFDLPDDLPFALDLRHIGGDRLVMMIPADPADTVFRNSDLPVIRLDGPDDGALNGSASLLPLRYPQPSQQRARFAASTDARPWILTTEGPRGLWPLAQARYPATAEGTLSDPLDSGAPGLIWHRLVIDGCIPAGCRLEVDARAYDSETPEGTWHRQPDPVWVPVPSELPFHASTFEPLRDRQGTFEILLQRGDGAVRQLNGRRLELRLRLSGDGRHSPAISAIRVYLPRRSWQDLYLPRHFRQQSLPQDAPGLANGADLRERFLGTLEGMLTPVEDRIAAAEAWLAPVSAPTNHLPRLAGLIGGDAPVHWPEARRRAWIAATGELQRTKGTLAGLCLALDIVTDGAISRGHVVPVETYRLRRAVATILGLDLDDRDHPLTLGTGENGNSIIGPSLILSDETARDFLALFAPELAQRTGDADAVAAFFERYAHRLSVVVHGPARPLRTTIEEMLEQQVPAGVQWQILETDRPFVLGLSPLLGIDTLLETNPAWRRVMLDDTLLGREGILHSPPALAPEFADPYAIDTRGDDER